MFHTCGYESCNQTFPKVFQLHRHYRKEHNKIITSVEEVRPIRLRLSQPKRQSPKPLEDSPEECLLIRLPMKKTLGGTSTSDPAEANENYSESKSLAKRPIARTRKNVDYNARSPNFRSSTSSTPEVSGKYLVSSHGSKITPTAVQHVPTPNVRPQAPASQPIVKSRSAEHNNYRPYTDVQSSGLRTSVYTRVCGVYSREKASPKKVKTNGGPYHCPRCDTQFTRSRGVTRHFVGCITKNGNPDSLKWTDHPSLQDTVKFYARSGHQGQEDGLLPQAVEVRRNAKEPRELPKDALLRSLLPEPLSSVVEEPVQKPPRKDALLQKDIVRPIHKRRDALRRSKYNPETISRDVLLAMGSHPNMDPLNAHLDILRKRFKVVNLESNMSTFRWDLVDPEQEREPKQPAEQEIESERSAFDPSEAQGTAMSSGFNDVQWYYDAPSSLPSRSSTKPGGLFDEVPFRVFSPETTHFGPMSTIFSSAFDRDPSARLMSSSGELWAAIFTMLERHYHEQKFEIRAAVRKYNGDVIGWVACHEVDALQARPVDPSTYLDWTTAAHYPPSQIPRFTTTKENAEEKVERSIQRKDGQGLASTIQARATEAQIYLVPIRRLVINALVVHPLYQGRGVASALLKSITEIADMKKIPIWIQAPEDPTVAQGVLKAGLFRRAGFTCAGELNENLDCYALGPQKRDREKVVSLGKYKWNYMLRWPQNLSQRQSSELQVSL
ncbi:MAG: hypothetical protein Q9175_000287 [Cornicularia normoerica]